MVMSARLKRISGDAATSGDTDLEGWLSADDVRWLVKIARAAEWAWGELLKGDDLSPLLAKRQLDEALHGEDSEGEDEAPEGS